jgi:hypothetical protein
MANGLFALWIVPTGGLLLFFLYAASLNLRRREAPQVELDEVMPSLAPVNLHVFSDLVDPLRESELAQAHSQREFLALQRQRVRREIQYLSRMTQNAAALQRLGYGQLHSRNMLIASLAQEMIDAGVHVRLYTSIGLIALHLWQVSGLYGFIPMPVPKLSKLQRWLLSNLVPFYQLLKDKAEHIAALKYRGLHETLLQNL